MAKGSNIAENKTELLSVEAVMFEYATKFLNKATADIRKAKKIDKGNLADLQVFDLVQTGNTYSITIGYENSNPASKYYDYINKGVKGKESGSRKSPGSPYQYKSLGVSKEFVAKILAWYLSHRTFIKNETQRTNLSGLQRKRKTLAALSENSKIYSIAYLTAKKIKREGLGKVGFFDNNVDKIFGKEFQDKLSKALGQDIILTINKTFNGNNNR